MTMIDINGIALDYRIEGSGPPLIWVSGTGMSGDAWHRYQVPHFRDRYTCITYDLRGSGKSDCPESPYTSRVMAEDLVGLMDALNIPAAHLAGFSLGAATIQELAINHPSRVSSAVLISTWSSTSLEHHIRLHFESRLMALQRGPVEVFKKFAFWMWAPSMVDDDFDRIAELDAWFPTIAGARDVSGYIGHFQADLAHETLDRLPQIACPTLVWSGAEDLVTRPAYNRRVAAAIPGAEIVEVPRGGHLAFLEHPEALNDAMDAFLARVPAGETYAAAGPAR
jgi:pimeloyl-ACP methyl ester carboxylesterase